MRTLLTDRTGVVWRCGSCERERKDNVVDVQVLSSIGAFHQVRLTLACPDCGLRFVFEGLMGVLRQDVEEWRLQSVTSDPSILGRWEDPELLEARRMRGRVARVDSRVVPFRQPEPTDPEPPPPPEPPSEVGRSGRRFRFVGGGE